MELSLRILREGRAEPGAPAPLLVLRHSLAAAGGAVLLRHVSFLQQMSCDWLLC